ncbi:LEA_2 domain-containing protein [Cephalotus follicularis]|uniref:LEA_2 domain-containing protein n=1 Tax=Cephalotus follicularis TaxID=3775 RepID=A0A1Q3CGW6_CEPFO|nr:LEA_2 domain-containing protein [Cephalotus follicularis]
MTSKHDAVPYDLLPPYPHQTVVVLPYYRPRPNRHLRRGFLFAAALLLLSGAVFLLYPSDPTLQLARLHLNHVQVNSSPKFTLDLSFDLSIKVHNRDVFSLDYDSLLVSVGYRGRGLGFVNSDGGSVRARGSSYVNATLELNGLEVIHDVIYLIADLAKGVVPFDTDTTVKGELGLFLFKIPIQGRVSCEVYVNTNNETIVRRDCCPE